MTERPDLPQVSVVIETVTARFGVDDGAAIPARLAPVLAGVEGQSYPRELVEVIVVVDPEMPRSTVDELRRRFPSVMVVEAPRANYFAAKNAGVAAARGAVVALLDGDCEPDDEWVERLVRRLEPGVAAVAGRTRYAGRSLHSRSLSVPDFSYVLSYQSGVASGFNINNAAFPRDVLLEHPFDERIRRNGGCVLLYHQLRAAGKMVVYEPGARATHASDDVRGRAFVHKHFGRGFDGVSLYRFDEAGVFHGSRLVQRYGAWAMAPIMVRRVWRDWANIVRYRRQMGVPAVAVPYFAVVALVTRSIEVAGIVTAVVDPRFYDRNGRHHRGG